MSIKKLQQNVKEIKQGYQTLEEEMEDYHARATFVPNPHNKSDLGIVMAPLMLGMVLYLIAGDSNALSPETLTVIDSSSDVISQALQSTSDEVVNAASLIKDATSDELAVLAEKVKDVPVQMQAALAAGTTALAAAVYNAKDYWSEKLSSSFDKENTDAPTASNDHDQPKK